MLDTAMQTQLKTYLANLREPIELVASLDDSAKSAQTRELLGEIAALHDMVSASFDGDDARQIEAGLTAGQAATQDEVVDLVRIERGHLVERGPYHLDGQVVGPHGYQRSLHGAADRRTGSGDYDGFRHDGSLQIPSHGVRARLDERVVRPPRRG